MVTKERAENEITEPEETAKRPSKTMRRGIMAGVLLVLLVAAIFLLRGQIQKAVTTVTHPDAQLTQQDPAAVAAQEETEDPAESSASSESATSQDAASTDTAEQWSLLLVNREHLLPRDFTVDLKKVGSVWVDSRIVQPLQQMVKAAKQDKVDLIVASAYRSVSRQATLYNEEIQSNEKQGYDKKTSTVLADQYMEAPGASEHHTGLALDIVTPTYQQLDIGFANTMAYQWLSAHAAEYGFVVRYPENKQKITGILFEPWHFRYVGTQSAKIMTEKKLCLEEYVQQLSQSSADK